MFSSRSKLSFYLRFENDNKFVFGIAINRIFGFSVLQAHGNHAGEGVDAAASENLAQVVVIVNADDAETVFQRKERACFR